MESRKIPIRTTDSSSTLQQTDTFEESPLFRVVDKRHFLQEDSTGAVTGPVEEKPRFPTYVEELLAKVSETERRFKEKVKLADEETARTRARLEAEYQRKLDQGRQTLLEPFLEVLDNLERALCAASAGEGRNDLLDGVRMTAELFISKLKGQGIEPIEVLNLPFDPNLSQAVGVVPVTDPQRDGIVVEEILRGYQMGNSLLRPAQVRVGQYRQ